tara:strand:- start:4054 stop:6921 length:2868 start_codon:yes stop_codon:yes gene_type:complete
MSEVKNKVPKKNPVTINPAEATTITIGSLGAIGISKPLFDRIKRIMDARGVFTGSTDTNIEVPLLDGENPDDSFADFFGAEDRRGMGDERAIEMTDLNVADREALLGGQEALTSVLNLALQENLDFLNLKESQQRVILNKIFRRQLENRVTQYTTQTPQQIMAERLKRFEAFGIDKDYLGYDDDVQLDPNAEDFNLQQAMDEYDSLISRAQDIRDTEPDFKKRYESAQGETKEGVLEDRIAYLQQHEGVSYDEAIYLIENDRAGIELTPMDKAIVEQNAEQFRRALEQEDIDDETARDLQRAVERDPRLKNILKLQQASDEQLKAFAEELGIPEDQIIQPTDEALATFDFMPLEIGEEAGEEVGQAIGRNTYQLTNMLRSGISKVQLTDFINALKTGGKIVMNTASVLMLGYAFGKLGVDVFSGEAKKYDVIDTLNALNNTILAGGSVGLGALGLAGAGETAGASMIFMGSLMLFRLSEATQKKFEVEKDFVGTGDSLNNNLRTNVIPNLRLLNNRHEQEINTNINKMNRYGELYYQYILKNKDGYKPIPQYNYTSDLPKTRDGKFGRVLDIGDPLLVKDTSDEKKQRYTEYKKITDTIAQNLLDNQYRNLRYYSGKQYTEQLQKLTNKKNMLSTALISSLSRTIGGGGHKEIGKVGAENSKNTEGIFETYDLTKNKLLLDKYRYKIYGGSSEGKTISQQTRQYDTNSVLQTTDKNLQDHFESQAKLDPNYQDALKSYTAYVNRQIVETAQRHARERKNMNLYNDFVLNFTPITEEQIENGVPINTQLKFTNNPLLKRRSTINPSESGIHIPPSSFWVYYYQANKKRFIQNDLLRISKISGGVVPPPKPPPVKPPYNPKPPKPAPPIPDPKPKPPFDPPKPDDPDKPEPPPFNPPPFDPPPHRPTSKVFPDGRSDFTPKGETEFDEQDIAFDPEVALFLLRACEIAYEPRREDGL